MWTVTKYPNLNDMNEIVSTLVFIEGNGYDRLQAELVGDLRQRSDTELVEMVLEHKYQTWFANRAEKESIASLKEALDKSDETNRTVRKSVGDLTLLVYDLIERLEIIEGSGTDEFVDDGTADVGESSAEVEGGES